MIILLTGYFSLAFHRLSLTAVVFTLCGDPLPKDFLIHKDELNLILVLFMSL